MKKALFLLALATLITLTACSKTTYLTAYTPSTNPLTTTSSTPTQVVTTSGPPATVTVTYTPPPTTTDIPTITGLKLVRTPISTLPYITHTATIYNHVTDTTITTFTGAQVITYPPPFTAYAPTITKSIIYNTTFSWDAVPNALLYEIQLSKDSSFLSGVVSRTTISNNYNWDSVLDASCLYYWRIMASISNGTTAWTQVSFTTESIQVVLPVTITQTIHVTAWVFVPR